MGASLVTEDLQFYILLQTGFTYLLLGKYHWLQPYILTLVPSPSSDPSPTYSHPVSSVTF